MNLTLKLLTLLHICGLSYGISITISAGGSYYHRLYCSNGDVRIDNWYAETTDRDAWYTGRSQIKMYLSASSNYGYADYYYGPLYSKTISSYKTSKETYYIIMYCDNIVMDCPVYYSIDYSCVTPPTLAPTFAPTRLQIPTGAPFRINVQLPPTASNKSSLGEIIGSTVGSAALSYIIYWCRKKCKREGEEDKATNADSQIVQIGVVEQHSLQKMLQRFYTIKENIINGVSSESLSEMIKELTDIVPKLLEVGVIQKEEFTEILPHLEAAIPRQNVPDEQKTDLEQKTTQDQASSGKLCIVCFENQSNTIVLPCAHLAFCLSCVKKLTNCPICRQTIKSSTIVYSV